MSTPSLSGPHFQDVQHTNSRGNHLDFSFGLSLEQFKGMGWGEGQALVRVLVHRQEKMGALKRLIFNRTENNHADEDFPGRSHNGPGKEEPLSDVEIHDQVTLGLNSERDRGKTSSSSQREVCTQMWCSLEPTRSGTWPHRGRGTAWPGAALQRQTSSPQAPSSGPSALS